VSNRTLRKAGVGLVAALALMVSGCSDDTEPKATDSAPTAPDSAPELSLLGAADALSGTSFKFEMELGDMMSGSGAVDPNTNMGTMTLTVSEPTSGQTVDMEIIFSDSDLWMNYGSMGAMLGASAPWMHLDLARLGDKGIMGFQPGQSDPADAADMLAGFENVEQVDARTFRGELNLSEVDGSSVADALDEPTGVVPMTVALDSEGRLESITMEIPETDDMPAQTVRIRYFDYGTDVSINPPSEDEVAPAPDLIYGMFS